MCKKKMRKVFDTSLAYRFFFHVRTCVNVISYSRARRLNNIASFYNARLLFFFPFPRVEVKRTPTIQFPEFNANEGGLGNAAANLNRFCFFFFLFASPLFLFSISERSFSLFSFFFVRKLRARVRTRNNRPRNDPIVSSVRLLKR